jgi:hypothetical protein
MQKRRNNSPVYVALLVQSDRPPPGPSRGYIQRRVARQRELLSLYNSVSPARGTRPLANRQADARLVLTPNPFAAADQCGRVLVACIGPFAQSAQAERLMRRWERASADAESRLVVGCRLAAGARARICADLGLVYGDGGAGGEIQQMRTPALIK